MTRAELLCELFNGFVEREGMPQQGDAMDLLFWEDITPEQTKWLSAFIKMWDIEHDKPGFWEAPLEHVV